MKPHLPLALSLLFPLGAIASATTQNALTVAVYDFAGADRTAASSARNVTALITADLSLETNLVTLARADLSRALSEQAFGISGLASSEAAAKIGQITGAKVLVTGHAIKTEGNRLVIVANIIGSETGRLFAARVEGGADQWRDLTTELSRKIAETISVQTSNLVAVAGESQTERLDRIVKGIQGKNRPTVSVNIRFAADKSRPSATAEGKLGAALLKAGFTVVDGNSDRKPDVEITGVADLSHGSRRGPLYSCRAILDLKVQERRTGSIIALDHQEATATDIARMGAARAAQADAVDQLAERILPLLAQ